MKKTTLAGLLSNLNNLRGQGWFDIVGCASAEQNKVMADVKDSILEMNTRPAPFFKTPIEIIDGIGDDYDRLVEFCAIQDIAIRDGNVDNIEPVYQGWRNLPIHIQGAVNAKAELIDAQREEVNRSEPYNFEQFIDDLYANGWQPTGGDAQHTKAEKMFWKLVQTTKWTTES